VVDFVRIPYELTIEHPVEAAFDWLTDYQEDDADRADAIIQDRRVVESSEDEIVLEGQLETLGREMEGNARVSLDPPTSWTARLYDHKERLSGIYEYELEPIDESSCRLTVDYRLAAPRLRDKLMLTLGRPLVRRELSTMWDGFVEAMDRELASPDP